MVKISRQKIHDSIAAAQKKYGSFDNLKVFVKYSKGQNVKLFYIAKNQLPESYRDIDALDITRYFENRRSRLLLAEDVAFAIEVWIEQKRQGG